MSSPSFARLLSIAVYLIPCLASAAPPETPAVRVEEQNVDANGHIRVHEQGTANVNVTNPALSVTGTVNAGNLPLDGSGNVRVAPTATAGRTILLATDHNAPEGNYNATPDVDLGDCRSLVAFTRFQGSAADVDVDLYLVNPDGSGFGPRGGLSLKSNTGSSLVIDRVWLFCGR